MRILKKIFWFFTPLVLLTILFLVIVLVINKDTGKGALQVTSIPLSQVFVDGKYIGQTPLCRCELPDMFSAGEHTIKLVPQAQGLRPYQEKITISPSVLTVVDRTFDKSSASSGSVITLESIEPKTPELLITSFPSKVDVYIDSNEAGTTPLLVKNLTASDHEIRLTREGYKEKTIKIRTVSGYRLEALVYLAIKINEVPAQNSIATSSALPKVMQVRILTTPTGFLRVREQNSSSSKEIGQVRPSEKYDLLEEGEGWYKIKLSNELEGWISDEYAEKE